MAVSGPKPVYGERKEVLVRFQPGLLARVDRYAEAHGQSRQVAIMSLIERGLDGPRNQVLVPTEPEPPVTHVQEVVVPRRSATEVVSPDRERKGYVLQTGPTPRTPGSFLKGFKR